MATGNERREQLDLVARVTAAFADEIDLRDPRATIPWPQWPDVHALVEHLGGVHRWVAEILRTQSAVPRDTGCAIGGGARAWYEEGRSALLDALDAIPPSTPCWILGDRVGTAGFWRRRMVFESVKHLIDIRASDGRGWEVASELSAEDYADGIDELLSEFLPRSRPNLRSLPGPVMLCASDIDRTWRISEDWLVNAVAPHDDGATRVVARAGDLALLIWERADPLREPEKFRIEGDVETLAALRSTAIHPW